MKVGISTACFHGKSEVEQSLLRLYPTGAKNIEIFLECFSEYEPDYVRELDRLCKQFGFAVSAVHPLTTQFEPQIFGPPCRQQREAMDIFQKVLAAAKILGAPLYNLHGPVMIKKSVDSGARVAGPFDAMLRAAGELGITVCWENVSWSSFNRPEFAGELMARLTEDNYGFTLDVKQAVRSGRPWEDYLEAMGGRLKNVHLCDMKGGAACLPGRGELDFKRLARLLRGMGYAGPVTLEVYADNFASDGELADAFHYLEDLFG